MAAMPSAADDIIDAVMSACEKINKIAYGEVRFAIQDGRLVKVALEQTLRVGKEINRPASEHERNAR